MILPIWAFAKLKPVAHHVRLSVRLERRPSDFTGI